MTIYEIQRIAQQAAEQPADTLDAYAVQWDYDAEAARVIAEWDAAAGPYDESIVDEERRR